MIITHTQVANSLEPTTTSNILYTFYQSTRWLMNKWMEGMSDDSIELTPLSEPQSLSESQSSPKFNFEAAYLLRN